MLVSQKMMRFIVIILLSVCHFATKAHGHVCNAKNIQPVGCVEFSKRTDHNIYIHSGKLSVQNEFVIDIEDDDSDGVSARRPMSPVKTTIAQFYLPPYLDIHQSTCKNQYSDSQSFIIPKNRYITQRVLRI